MFKAGNNAYRVKTDGFHGELFLPVEDKYSGKALICFGGSDGKFELSRMLASVFQSHGLTTLALAYGISCRLAGEYIMGWTISCKINRE